VHALMALAVVKLALRLEIGPEYDTNANRAEVVSDVPNVDTPTGSALMRTTLRGSLLWAQGSSVLRTGAGLGAKFFFDPQVYDQNMLVGQANVDERLRVGRTASLGWSADYYDAAQQDARPPCASAPTPCVRHRDFRTGSLAMRLTLADEPGSLTLSGGYRGFAYKPDPDFDFEAAQANVVATARAITGGPDAETEWTLTATYHLERRWFRGRADQLIQHRADCYPGASLGEDCVTSSVDARVDWFHEAGLEASYLRTVLVTLGYAVQLNQSTSFGQSLIRHLFTLRLAFRLPWQLYVTAKAQVLLNSYFDPLLLDLRRLASNPTFISIDEENRNSLLLDVERPIGTSGVAVEARYSLYTNELSAAPVSFLRQVIYLGISYRVNSR
jgi:hypothetical protein